MKIAEVSQRYGLSQDTLRYYENAGLIPPVNRNSGGIRDFGEDDLKWVALIKCMRAAGLTIDVLTEYVKLFREGDSTLLQRQQLLVEQRQHLVEKKADVQKALDRLDVKLERYAQMVNEKEKHPSHTHQIDVLLGIPKNA